MADEVWVPLSKPNYENELIAIIRSNEDPNIIREKLEDYHESDLADVLEILTREERLKVYRLLGMEATSELFTYLEDVEKYIDELDSDKAADILETMDADDAVEILDELDEDKRKELELLIDKKALVDINLIQSYDEDEIGSKMTTNFISIRQGLSIKQAMRELVSQAAENDNISTIYVCEKDGSFYGAVDLKDLIIARKDDNLEDLVVTSYPYVYAHEKIDQCIEELKDYSEDSIPVLNERRELLGVITSQEIVEVVDDEMSEDYAKLAGLLAEEDLNEPLKESMRKRIPWLVLLLFLGLIVSSIVGIFENVMAELTLIVCFQSLVLDMAGNTGTQSLAVTIRVLMDEQLTARQKVQLVLKEMRVGFSNGILLACIALIAVGLYIMLLKDKPPMFAFATSGCIGLSLIITMIISSSLGTLIPMFFKKLHFDPAVASGPLITTINDMIAVITYYGLSWLLLIRILHITG